MSKSRKSLTKCIHYSCVAFFLRNQYLKYNTHMLFDRFLLMMRVMITIVVVLIGPGSEINSQRIKCCWTSGDEKTNVGQFNEKTRSRQIAEWSRWSSGQADLFVANRTVLFKGNAPKYQQFNGQDAIEIITPRKCFASEIILTIK